MRRATCSYQHIIYATSILLSNPRPKLPGDADGQLSIPLEIRTSISRPLLICSYMDLRHAGGTAATLPPLPFALRKTPHQPSLMSLPLYAPTALLACCRSHVTYRLSSKRGQQVHYQNRRRDKHRRVAVGVFAWLSLLYAKQATWRTENALYAAARRPRIMPWRVKPRAGRNTMNGRKNKNATRGDENGKSAPHILNASGMRRRNRSPFQLSNDARLLLPVWAAVRILAPVSSSRRYL